MYHNHVVDVHVNAYVCFLIHSLSNIAVLYICVIFGFLEGLMEDWFHQMSNPRKIKNLLTYLLTNSILVAPDETPKNAASHQGLHFLLTKRKKYDLYL